MEKIRLQKILADSGVASRRSAEALIAAGKVKVNGHVAAVGDKADPRADHITVSGKRLEPPPALFYIMLNKPRGVVTTMKDEQGRKCVAALVEDAGVRLFPVGRLDRDSEGLLLLTNDGTFANAVAHPARHIAKTYRVTLRPGLTDAQMLQFRGGMTLRGDGEPDYTTAPAELFELSRSPLLDADGRPIGERMVVEIVLREGRNRQIRRMFEQMGIEVARLRRVAVGGLRLGMLPAGKWRELEEAEVAALRRAAGMETANAGKTKQKGGGRRAGNSPRR